MAGFPGALTNLLQGEEGIAHLAAMHNRHGWTSRTEDGEKREVRAVKFGKTWTIETRTKSSPFWLEQSPPALDDLEALRDLLWRKYQRRRASYEEFMQVKAMVEERAP